MLSNEEYPVVSRRHYFRLVYNSQFFLESIRLDSVVEKLPCLAFLHLMESYYFVRHRDPQFVTYRGFMGYCQEKTDWEPVQNQNRALNCDARIQSAWKL